MVARTDFWDDPSYSFLMSILPVFSSAEHDAQNTVVVLKQNTPFGVEHSSLSSCRVLAMVATAPFATPGGLCHVGHGSSTREG